MKRKMERFSVLCVKAVQILLLIMLAVFSFWAIRYSVSYPRDLSEDYMTVTGDSLLGQAAALAAAVMIGALLYRKWGRLPEDKQQNIFLKVAALLTVFLGLGLTLWVCVSKETPVWDQMQVYLSAMEFKNGNYSSMLGYMFMCTQQYGTTFLYEIILAFGGGYKLLQFFNVFMAMLIVFGTYCLTDELFREKMVSLYSVIAAFCFVPMWFYTNFVYGEMLSIAFGIWGLWGLVRFCRKKQTLFLIFSMFCLVWATLARRNTLILLIAVAITMFLYALEQGKAAYLVIIVLAIGMPFASIKLVEKQYEYRSGLEVGAGIPSTSYIAMGMQQSSGGSGVYNGYNNSMFRGAGESDTAKANAIATAEIKRLFKEYTSNPKEGLRFYKNKVQQQWIEPTVCSYVMTATFEQEPKGITEAVYYGGLYDPIVRYMNGYQTVLYLFTLLYCVWAMKNNRSIIKCLPMIFIVGGVLFSVLWEAKSRYVLPYLILMFPYMAKGMQVTVTGLEQKLTKGKRKKKA